MANEQISALRKQVDDVSQQYAAEFAGQSRASRDVDLLDRLIARLRETASQLRALPERDAEGEDALKTADQNLEIYATERRAILAAKNAPPELVEFGGLGTQANFVFARYRRHFAGRARPTRDLGLLAEMVDDLQKIEKRMKDIAGRVKNEPGLKEDLDTVGANIKLYVAERGEIVDARGVGTLEQQADILAEVANDQFKIYADHFAGKSRLTRRPQLLQRMIDNLKNVKDRMESLRKGGLRGSSNDNNITIVEQNVQMYINELGEIRKARAQNKLVDLQGALGGAANDLMAEYSENFAGMDRRTRDLDRMSKLCDGLGEVLRQMVDLGRAEPNGDNTRNIAIVTDNLGMLENEYNAIADAKRNTVAR
jgi:hypothetical protein